MSPPQPPRLLDQVRETIRLKHFSLKTEKSYVYYIRDFILFHNKRHPRKMGVDEIVVGAQGCEDHHDLHPRAESGGAGGAQSVGWVGGQGQL